MQFFFLFITSNKQWILDLKRRVRGRPVTSLGQLIKMDLGFNFKNLFNKTRRASPPAIKQIPVTEKVFTDGILNGRRKSIMEVGAAIRTGIRLGSITKESALKSK